MVLVFASLVLVPVALYACGDDDNSVDPGPKDAGGTETSTPADTGGGTDTGTADTGGGNDGSTKIPVRCTQAQFDQDASAPVGGDFTGFPGADISFPTGAAPAQYTNRCVKVKQGSTVTFAGNFAAHPLQPNGGDTPNPIPHTSADPDGGALSIVMSTPGTFGYECEFHPTTMFGAVQVVP